MAGKTDVVEFPHPTRLTGNPATDLAVIHEYMWALYRVVFLERGGLVQNEDLGGLAGSDSVATDDIQDEAVTLAKQASIATDRILGRGSPGPGLIELLTFTSAARALCDDGNFAAMRLTLGLGSLATQEANSVAITGGAINGVILQMPSFPVAGLPNAATNVRGLIYVPDEVGGAVPAFSDGVNWRRVTDRAIVS